MPVNEYLSPQKTEYIKSLEALKRHKKTLLALSVNNYACKQFIKKLNLVIESESRKQEKGKQIIEKIQNQTLKDILIYRYIYFYDWRKIVRIIRYSETQVFRLHNTALIEFNRIEQTF